MGGSFWANSGGGVTGPSAGGTTNTVAKFTAASAIGDSSITDDGTNVTFSAGILRSAAGVALALSAQVPAAAASTTAGVAASLAAASATAGTANAGAAAGGAVTITAGNAARLTSGNAAGGAITNTAGTGIGSSAGGNLSYTAGTGGATDGRGGHAQLYGGTGGATDGEGGSVVLGGGLPSGTGNGGYVVTALGSAESLTNFLAAARASNGVTTSQENLTPRPYRSFQFSTSATGGATFQAFRSNNATLGTLAAVTTDQIIGIWAGRGAASGTAWDTNLAGMYVNASQTHTASNQGRYIQFRVVANNATAQTNAWRVEQDAGFYPETDNVSPIGSATLRPTNVFGVQLTQAGANGQSANILQATTTINAATAATITATNLIPAGSLVLGVETRVTTTFDNSSGLTTFSIGDGSDADRFGLNIARTSGTTTDLTKSTVTTPPIYTTATSVVLTADAGTFNVAAGTIRITVHFISLTAATS